MSQKAFPKRKAEIEQNIAALQVLMQLLTFAQFGALIYTFLRTQWHKRHETAEKFSKLKTRASSIGARLRSRSSKGRSESGSDMEAAVTVAGGDVVTAPANASGDGGDDGDGDDGGSGGDGGGGGGGNGGGGIELQTMSCTASTEPDDNTRIVWKRNPSVGVSLESADATLGVGTDGDGGEQAGTSSVEMNMAMHASV